MTARTFGRKGAIGEPAQRRAALVAHQPRSFRPASPEDDAEARRTAFLDTEKLRAAVEPGGPSPLEWLWDKAKGLRTRKPAAEATPADRSLKVAWPVWFLLGLAGGHRFYLRRPVTGALMALLFLGCLGAVAMQRYGAFFGLGLSWLWMLADGIRMRKLYMTTGGGA